MLLPAVTKDRSLGASTDSAIAGMDSCRMVEAEERIGMAVLGERSTDADEAENLPSGALVYQVYFMLFIGALVREVTGALGDVSLTPLTLW